MLARCRIIRRFPACAGAPMPCTARPGIERCWQAQSLLSMRSRWANGGSGRCSSGSSDAGKRSLARAREAQALATQRRQAEQLLRYKPVAPFQESRQSTSGTATLMVLLLRPTSPSLLRLAAGLGVAAAGVAGAHWVLHPSDPFFVLSGSFGAFTYVAVVGTSHSVLWYAGSLPLLVLLGLPNWPSYARSLEANAHGQIAGRRRAMSRPSIGWD
mmetsp:Transcript_62431/g.118495  ORF Transcript_62431/g.118495 Transcript_62431/m.118495 type:complete len:214 (-) Transcript_62431:34-675(-)